MSSCMQFVLSVALLTTAHAGADLLRSKRHIVIAGDTPPSALNLRVCNAFTDRTPIALVLKPAAFGEMPGHDVHDVDLTKEEPLHYKSCKNWPINLRRGDSLEFQQQGAQLGAFAVTSVPQWDTTLLLIIQRKGSSGRPVFTSHTFGQTKNSQVAVLDMYDGPSKHSVAIQSVKETSTDKKGRQLSVLDTENLAYNNVVAVAPGNYVGTLAGADQRKSNARKLSRVALTVVSGENYVAMRVGTAGKPDFPEELVVFPSSASYCVNGLSGMLLAATLLSLLMD